MIALLVGNPDLARQIREGEVKGLLLPGSKRSDLVPDIPTFAESGPSGDQTKFTPWFGFFAPKGTPKEYVETMSDEVNAIMANPEFREKFLTTKGLEAAGSKPDAVTAKFHGVGQKGRGRSGRDLRREARRVTNTDIDGTELRTKIMADRHRRIVRTSDGTRDRHPLPRSASGSAWIRVDQGQLQGFVYEKNLRGVPDAGDDRLADSAGSVDLGVRHSTNGWWCWPISAWRCIGRSRPRRP